MRLYEPQERGPGGAYQDDLRSNLLNIPAGNMSALADERLDFVGWLRRQNPAWLAGHGVEGAIDPAISCPDRCSAPTWPTPTSGRARWRQAGA